MTGSRLLERAALQDILTVIEAIRNVHLACFHIRYLAGMSGESVGEKHYWPVT